MRTTRDIPIPRSIYAGKLRQYPDFAFGGETAFAHRGEWHSFFKLRIGPAFDGRIVLEIGCADAEFLTRLAANHPMHGFIGLDWKCKAIYDGAGRVVRDGLRNVALLRARGQDIHEIAAAGEIDEIWLFHPDPCDKPNELKNRLIGEPFMKDVHHILSDRGGMLAIKTDHPGYYQWVLALLGLPEPEWFKPTDPTRLSGQAPRTRTRDLMPPSALPPASRIIRQRFSVTVNSPDFWQDPIAQQLTSGHLFANQRTHFETRFTHKRLPIYYIELRS